MGQRKINSFEYLSEKRKRTQAITGRGPSLIVKAMEFAAMTDAKVVVIIDQDEYDVHMMFQHGGTPDLDKVRDMVTIDDVPDTIKNDKETQNEQLTAFVTPLFKKDDSTDSKRKHTLFRTDNPPSTPLTGLPHKRPKNPTTTEHVPQQPETSIYPQYQLQQQLPPSNPLLPHLPPAPVVRQYSGYQQGVNGFGYPVPQEGQGINNPFGPINTTSHPNYTTNIGTSGYAYQQGPSTIQHTNIQYPSDIQMIPNYHQGNMGGAHMSYCVPGNTVQQHMPLMKLPEPPNYQPNRAETPLGGPPHNNNNSNGLVPTPKRVDSYSPLGYNNNITTPTQSLFSPFQSPNPYNTPSMDFFGMYSRRNSSLSLDLSAMQTPPGLGSYMGQVPTPPSW